MKLFATSLDIKKDEEVSAQDIVDAIETLSLSKKLIVQTPPPGKGPNFFLEWASEELKEAASSSEESFRNRKFYNASVYSKGAVECLIDWFLSKFLLQYTISPMAGIAQKLEALDSENLLGLSFSLFNDIVFEPRNRGIHKFELIEEQEAKHGYELANLTIKNCVNTVSPSDAAVFYGDLEVYRGKDALEKLEHKQSKDLEAFYFVGLGNAGTHGVLFDREYDGGKISVLSSLGGGEIESRSCKVRGNFTSEQIRGVFTKLESTNPVDMPNIGSDEMRHVLDSLIPSRRERLTRKSSGRKKPRC